MTLYSDPGIAPRTNAYAPGANMPSVSRKQQKAMHAAASGNSTIGIPKSVGSEYAKADKAAAKPRRKTGLKAWTRSPA